jgi:hypothetical protein
MSKYPGRIISATPPTVSLSEASGVWTLEEAAQYQEAGTWPLAIPGPSGADPNFNQTVLLLHGDGTNGAQNNTFLDGSTNNFTITRNGNTTQGTFSPFSLAAGEFSNFFDGATGTRLTLASNSAFAFGTGAYTMEAFVYINARGADDSVVFDCGSNTNSSALRVTATGQIALGKYGAANVITSSAGDVPLNQWVHIAIVRNSTSSNDTKMYANGVLVATGTDNNNWTVTTTPSVGGFNISGFTLNGYISNLRIVKGTAVYTSAFTPSTTPLTAISNTSLLTCQSNRFVDNSTNAFAITRNGDVRVTPFSPFAPSAAYDPAVNGGSGYFDGSGDYLTAANNSAFAFGTGDFAIEAWVYASSLAIRTIFSNSSGSGAANINFYITSDGKLNANNLNTVQIDSTGSITANSWNHVAITKASGTYYFWINGAASGSHASLGTNNLTDSSCWIGARPTPTDFWNGSIADLRVVKGTAVYTAAFTPPTAPLTAITNTSLLCNFTNAGIFDNTGKNNLETVGNAQIDTGTKKYGTGSMEFDGTGDWLLMADNPDQRLGTGNFTIEFWVYLATGDIGSARGLVAKGTSTTGFLVSLDSSEKVVFTFASSTITSTGSITLDAWNHIAVVREGTGSNQTKIYIGGTNDGTGTVSTDFNQTSVMYVGCNRTAGDPMKGFIDDLRITKGVARYTTTFTPPTQAFSDF